MQSSRKLVVSEANAAIRATPSLRAAAKRLGVNVSTLSRAVKRGMLAGPRRPGGRSEAAAVQVPGPGQTFQDWAETTFDLTHAERELVRLGQRALDLAADPEQPAAIQLGAMGQYRACLKDLRLPVEDEHYGHVKNTPVRFPSPVA